MKHSPLKSISAGICQVITSLVCMLESVLCYSLVVQLLCQSFCQYVWIFSLLIYWLIYASLLFDILLFDSSPHPFWSPSSPSICFSLPLSAAVAMLRNTVDGQEPNMSSNLIVCLQALASGHFFPQNGLIAKSIPRKNSLYRIPHADDA